VKILGLCLIIAGAFWGFNAIKMETSITTEGQTIGSGIYSMYVPSQTVHNLSLADQRRNHLIGAGITLISGILLFGFGSLKPQEFKSAATSDKKCPFCAELIKREATVCRYCGKDQPVNEGPIENVQVTPQENKIKPVSIYSYVFGGIIVIAIIFSVLIATRKDPTGVTSKIKADEGHTEMKAQEIPAGVGKIATVTETMNSGGYSYVEAVDEKGVKVWLALPVTNVVVGDKIEYPESPPMSNFQSKTLNKTFKEIHFIPGIRIVK